MITDILIDPFELPYMSRALIELTLLSLVGAVCAVHFVLRRRAFLTDALQHTVFPGIAVAFLLGQSLLLGAASAMLMSVVMLAVISRRSHLDSDSTLAVLVSGFFALGVVLVSRSSSYQH